jgi:hypothetical protein
MWKIQVDLVQMRSRHPGIFLMAGVCLLILSSPGFADDAALPDGYGYLVILVETNPRERVRQLFMAKVESDEVTALNMEDFRAAGSNSWMAVAQAPKGRYYWSVYEPFYGLGVSESRTLNQIHRRSAPSSADDTFEIKDGVINYIGDWRMRVATSQRFRLEPEITYDVPTLERFAIDNPELANSLPIYLSMMGKESISLEELAKILETEN